MNPVSEIIETTAAHPWAAIWVGIVLIFIAATLQPFYGAVWRTRGDK